MKRNRRPTILDILPPFADYPWRATGVKIEAYTEQTEDIPSEDRPDEWQQVAVAASPDIAKVIVAVVNATFRNGMD